jgi:hypothetical protein
MRPRPMKPTLGVGTGGPPLIMMATVAQRHGDLAVLVPGLGGVCIGLIAHKAACVPGPFLAAGDIVKDLGHSGAASHSRVRRVRRHTA